MARATRSSCSLDMAIFRSWVAVRLRYGVGRRKPLTRRSASLRGDLSPPERGEVMAWRLKRPLELCNHPHLAPLRRGEVAAACGIAAGDGAALRINPAVQSVGSHNASRKARKPRFSKPATATVVLPISAAMAATGWLWK